MKDTCFSLFYEKNGNDERAGEISSRNLKERDQIFTHYRIIFARYFLSFLLSLAYMVMVCIDKMQKSPVNECFREILLVFPL
jgi:hypothetical protein